MVKPARKIPPSRGKHSRYEVPFIRKKSMILCEGSIERDYVKVLDFDPTINEIISQPIAIFYSYRGKVRVYFPDFKVILTNGDVWIVEIKPAEKLRKEENLIKYVVGKLYCDPRGWEYKVVTEDEIRQGFLIKNLNDLRSFGTTQVDYKLLIYITQKLKEVGTCTIKDLCIRCTEMDNEDFYKGIYYLIYHHNIYMDLVNQELNDDSEISIQLEV